MIADTINYFHVKVSGESCWPDLVPRKTYVAQTGIRPKIGDLVVFINPQPSGEPQYIIKKVKSIWGETLAVGGTVSWSASYTLTTPDVLGVVRV